MRNKLKKVRSITKDLAYAVFKNLYCRLVGIIYLCVLPFIAVIEPVRSPYRGPDDILEEVGEAFNHCMKLVLTGKP